MDPHLIIAIFHILFVVPFFFYFVFMRAATPEWLYSVLFGLGLFVLVYHAYKSFVKWAAKSPSLWVNLFHIWTVAPMMIYIGYNGKKSPRSAYELLAILTFGALGYHMYNLVMISRTIQDGD